MWTLENMDTCIQHLVEVPNGSFHIKQPGKSGHLVNLDTSCWSLGVHNTQIPLYHQIILKGHHYFTELRLISWWNGYAGALCSCT